MPSPPVAYPTWEVAPLLRLRSLEGRVFDYLPPEQGEVSIGSVVEIPFGRRRVRGVVLGPGEAGRGPTQWELRRIIHISGVTVTAEALSLARAMSRYYLAPMGACLGLTAPEALAAEGAGEGRKVSWVIPTGRTSGLPGMRPPTARQMAALALVPTDGAPAAEVCRLAGVSRALLSGLTAKGLLRVEERAARPVEPLFEDVVPTASPCVVLSAEQERAVGRLRELARSSVPRRALLWGITGSGKTDVYMRLIDDMLAQGRASVVLVPEIGLTAALSDRLRARFGPSLLAVLHSGLSPAARARELARVRRGEALVVVGARSAVFAPVRDPGLFVIDEAHDHSYKNDEEPRYHARWVAWRRAQQTGSLLVEGTATPRLESLVDNPVKLHLRTRPAGGTLPEVEVVDMRRQGGRGTLSPRVWSALRQVARSQEQAIVLLNRRGHSGFLFCPECGAAPTCPECDVTLTLHRRAGAPGSTLSVPMTAPEGRGAALLVCHHCGRRLPLPAVCPACGVSALARGVPGTQRLDEELVALLGRGAVFRLDSDLSGGAGRTSAVLSAFAGTHPAVLVGTQMVAKGHDFAGVTLVVVADADTGLYIPDFRAGERTYQLLTQVVGRAGRGERPSRALIQTWNPDAPCIKMAIESHAREFYRLEMRDRARLGFPPVTRLVRVVVSAAQPDRVAPAALHLAGECSARAGRDGVRGPAPLPRLRGRHRAQLVVALPPEEEPANVLGDIVSAARPGLARRGIDVSVDVDPEWFA